MSTTESYLTPRTTITDPLFLQGLSSILAPYYARQASREEIQEVTERAESFYLASQSSEPVSTAPTGPTSDITTVPSVYQPTDSTAPSTTAPEGGGEPPYPLSFSHLAHLISTGAPIPGIKDVPDKLTQEEPSESREEIRNRKKPWEVQQGRGDTEEVRDVAEREDGGDLVLKEREDESVDYEIVRK